MKTTFLKRNLFLGLCVASVGLFSACSSSDDDSSSNNNNNNGGEKVDKPFILSLAGSGESEYLLQLNDVETGKYSIKDNNGQLEQSGYTWLYSPDQKHMLGLLYKKGEPGICLGYDLTSNGTLNKPKEFQIVSRYTTYGFFDGLAITAVGGQEIVGSDIADGVIFNSIDLNNNYALTPHKAIRTLNVFAEGEIGTFSGIVDTGKGTFLTGVVVSLPRDKNAEGGSSSGEVVNPNKVWVAEIDKDFNIVNKISDDRISYSAGRYKSQYYSQIEKAEDGTVYVFSGSYESTTDLPAGALKLTPDYKKFDENYYFNIQEQSKVKFRKVWPIADHYFLLEIYNTAVIERETPATQYAVVNMKTKDFTMLQGIPAMDNIVNTGLPYAYEGKLYMPITEKAQDPAIYVIDPVSAKATKGVVVTGTQAIKAIGFMK